MHGFGSHSWLNTSRVGYLGRIPLENVHILTFTEGYSDTYPDWAK